MTTNAITRREFVRKTGAVSAGITLATVLRPFRVEAKSKHKAERPNILFAIADDWSWPHAGVYGDKVAKTPTFDRIASEGMLFHNAFCTAPTCTASRGAILTGQDAHCLEAGGNLWSVLPSRFAVYPDILEANGYCVGYSGKGWSPGNVADSGRQRNPAGPAFPSFAEFLRSAPSDKPFCFWFGSFHPHRPYEEGIGRKSGMRADDVSVPPFLPDEPEVRSDLLDYYYEVQQFDLEVEKLLEVLEVSGRADNTIVVMTSDNGMPFPRAKANLYEAGIHMPLAIRWPNRIRPGTETNALIGFTDFAPTFLEAAGIKIPADMTGRSFLDLLTTGKAGNREAVFTERERHANTRKGDLGYPMRAVRTKDFLYIRNFEPDRWPAGDPELYYAVGPFGDIDQGPTKRLLLEKRNDKDIRKYFSLACEKRPAEELFDLRVDPWVLRNVADKAEYAAIREKLRARLDKWMRDTADPRAVNAHDDRWDRYKYYGERAR
ncbi:MAG: sulfatase [Armatimonadetes bacterium]|nr:sulfatase [Armatimonadota bacterium]